MGLQLNASMLELLGPSARTTIKQKDEMITEAQQTGLETVLNFTNVFP